MAWMGQAHPPLYTLCLLNHSCIVVDGLAPSMLTWKQIPSMLTWKQIPKTICQSESKGK